MQIFDSKIDSYIIQNLQKGGILSASLVGRIENDLNVTKQAVYKTLRNLKKREIVVERGKLLSLNILWIQKMNNFFESTKIKYTSTGEDCYLNLSQGDSITYRFKNFNTTDIFWGMCSLSFPKELGIIRLFFCIIHTSGFLLHEKILKLNFLEQFIKMDKK